MELRSPCSAPSGETEIAVFIRQKKIGSATHHSALGRFFGDRQNDGPKNDVPQNDVPQNDNCLADLFAARGEGRISLGLGTPRVLPSFGF